MSGVAQRLLPAAVRRLRERNRLATADIRHGRLRVELVELVHAVPPCISCRRALPARRHPLVAAGGPARTGPTRQCDAGPPTPPPDGPFRPFGRFATGLSSSGNN